MKSSGLVVRWNRALMRWSMRLWAKLAETKGQGTTEFAILAVVLVAIAIFAFIAVRPNLQELWDAIAGINGL